MTEPDHHLGPAEADAEAVASAESVQEIYAALAPELLDAGGDQPVADAVSDDELAAQRVHVVLVAHDGSRWLGRTLQALRDVDGPMTSVTAVDTGSRDDTASLLANAPIISTVLGVEASTGFPAAVAQAVAVVPTEVRTPVAPGASPHSAHLAGTREWLWLVHDDCAPHPDSLRWLLHAAIEHEAAVVGPKVLDWDGQRLLVEMGLSITGSGRRYTGLEGREYDQGQHDDRRDVLAVGTAGMLVRRDVWDTLGGLDPQIDLFRDDVDFGWRARLAGYRVVVEPRAVVEHAAAATAGRRRLGATQSRGPLTDRRNAVHVLLANAGRWTFVPVLLRVVVGSLLRSVGFVVGKVPGVAWDEAVAVAGAVSPRRLAAARRWRRNLPRVGSVRGLRPTLGTQARHALDNASAVVSGRSGGQDVPDARRRSVPQQALVGDEHEALPVGDGWLARVSGRPGLWLVAVMALLTLISARTVLIGGRLRGGALLPAPDSAADWFASYVAGWHPVGLGSAEGAPPYVGALAALSVPLLGSASVLVSLLLLGAVPAATGSAWWATRGMALSVPVRLWAAATYGVLVLSTGAVAAGRLGTCVTAVVAPIGVRAVAAALQPDAPLRHAWRAALLLSFAAAFTPVVWPVAVVAALVVVAVSWRAAAGLLRWLVISLTPAVLLLPWLPTLAARPELLLAEAGMTGQGAELADPSLPAWAPALLGTGGPAAVPTGMLVLVPALGLLALTVSRSSLVRLSWVLALVAMAAAVATTRVGLSTPAGEGTAAGWPGPGVVVAGLGLLAAAAVGIDPAALWARDRRVAGGVVLLAFATTAVVGVQGFATSTADPLTRTADTLLPVYVVEESAGPDQVRTLVLRQSGTGESATVEFTVVAAAPTSTGDAEVLDPEGFELLAPVVSDVVAARGAASAGELAAFGVRYVFVPDLGATDLVEALDGQPGLVRASAPDGGAIWRVEGTTARVRLLTADQTSDQPLGVVVPAESVDVTARIDVDSARTVVVADLDDDGWSATLDGVALERTTHAGGLLAFDLPEGSGELRIVHDDPSRAWLVAVQAVAILVVLVLTVPALGGRRESLEESLL